MWSRSTPREAACKKSIITYHIFFLQRNIFSFCIWKLYIDQFIPSITSIQYSSSRTPLQHIQWFMGSTINVDQVCNNLVDANCIYYCIHVYHLGPLYRLRHDHWPNTQLVLLLYQFTTPASISNFTSYPSFIKFVYLSVEHLNQSPNMPIHSMHILIR